MKYYLIIVLTLLCSDFVFGQFPDGFYYQTVARTTKGTVKINSEVNLRISILQGEPYGFPVCVERFLERTSPEGLINLVVGSKEVESFKQVDWKNGPYFLKIEMDDNGGSDFKYIGTSQLLSVPYALHAKTSESTIERDPLFNTWDKSSGIVIHENQIRDLKHFKNSDETDPVFTNSIAATIKPSDIERWNNPKETDPVFNSSIAKGITQSDITNWDNKSNFDGKYTSLSELPTFHKIAFSGNYDDLLNIPENIISLTKLPVKGDLLYFNGQQWVTLPIGKAGQILTIDGSGLPFWK